MSAKGPSVTRHLRRQTGTDEVLRVVCVFNLSDDHETILSATAASVAAAAVESSHGVQTAAQHRVDAFAAYLQYGSYGGCRRVPA